MSAFDSKSLKTAVKTYLYRVKNDMFFKCHNCVKDNQSLTNFLKFLDNKKYEQYLLERYKQAPSTPSSKFTNFKPEFKE